jgi:hypothetical protein
MQTRNWHKHAIWDGSRWIDTVSADAVAYSDIQGTLLARGSCSDCAVYNTARILSPLSTAWLADPPQHEKCRGISNVLYAEVRAAIKCHGDVA